MNFVLHIDMDNAAFDDNPELELSKILGTVARKIVIEGDVYGSCMDMNGKKCGDWAIVAEDLVMGSLSDSVSEYFESFRKWFDAYVSEVIYCEKRPVYK